MAGRLRRWLLEGADMSIIGLILLILLIMLLLGSLPTYSYSKKWGYGPSGLVGVLVVVLIVLLVLRVI